MEDTGYYDLVWNTEYGVSESGMHGTWTRWNMMEYGWPTEHDRTFFEILAALRIWNTIL